MNLAVVVDYVVTRLSNGLDPSTTVSDAAAETDHLPAVTVDISQVADRMVGVGRTPRSTSTGALAVPLTVDLANPTLDLGGGETLELIPADRLSLVLPHGPLVKADGTQDGAFRAADLSVRDTSAWTVVSKAPTGKQVQPDIRAGLLRFGQALPASGTLTVTYRIGAWDTVVSRFQGLLTIVVTADRDNLPALTRKVADVLDANDASLRLTPLSWSHSSRPDRLDLPATVRGQSLGYQFDVEVERALLTTSGGVIGRVAVWLRSDENDQPKTETFDVVGPR